jgi:hypothetical protein
MVAETTLSKCNLLLLASLFLVEISITAMLLALHMNGARPYLAFPTTGSGMMFLCAVIAFFVSSAIVINQYVRNKRFPQSQFRLVVAMNLITVILLVVTGELTLRTVTRSTHGYQTVGKLVLKPKSWETIRLHLRQVVDQVEGDDAFHEYDELLGWTLGRNTFSADRKYWTSSEGLRAPHEGVSFARTGKQTDIAVVGDSFTFGYEVTYEETYGFYLEQMLGSPFRVLNFGVSGYGLDQAFLRYKRDVRPWKPKIVVLGFISDDVKRTMRVYPFLKGLGWWDYPYSKPRLVLREGVLENLNLPALPPESILSRKSISELPLIEYQRGYTPSDWQESFQDFSYLVRLLKSLIPSWSAVSPKVSNDALRSINVSILKRYIQSAEQEGSIPLVVFFPSKNELEQPRATLPVGLQVLEQAGIPYIDTTPCISQIDSAEQFLADHYSAQGNAAVAKCLLPVIGQLLRQNSVAHGKPRSIKRSHF